MKFNSEITVKNKISDIKKDFITTENVLGSLEKNLPIVLNGFYTLSEVYEIVKKYDSIMWIEANNDEINNSTEILSSIIENQIFLSTNDFSTIFLNDSKLLSYNVIIINNFHHKNQYFDLIIANLLYIQSERKKLMNCDNLKIVLLTAPLSVDFLVEIFDNSVIYNVNQQQMVNGEEKCIDCDIKIDKYLQTVLNIICQLFKGQISPIISPKKVAVLLANQKHVRFVKKWLNCHFVDLFSEKISLADDFDNVKQFISSQNLIYLTNNSKINELFIFDYVIDCGLTEISRFNFQARVDIKSITKIDLTESLIRANIKRSLNGCLIKLYTDETIERYLTNLSNDNYYRIQCDSSDFLLCQLSLGEAALSSFRSRFSYNNVMLKSSFENLVRSKLIKLKIRPMENNNKNKLLTSLKQYEITELGQKCLSLRLVDCKQCCLLVNAAKNDCLLCCMTLVSLLRNADTLFIDNIQDSATEHIKTLREFYNGNDDFLFLLKLYRHYISLSKEERPSFIKQMNIDVGSIKSANKLRSSIKSSLKVTKSKKHADDISKIIRSLIETYPLQIAKYSPAEKVYKRSEINKGGMIIDPFSFSIDENNPPKFVFYYSCYSVDSVVYMKHVSVISESLWNEFCCDK